MSAASDNNGDPPDPLAALKRLVHKYLGYGGFVIFLVLLWALDKCAFDLVRFPGVDTLVQRLTQKSLPRADPARFSVAVAHLSGDTPNYANENVLIQDLTELKGIKVLRFDRTIDLSAGNPEEAEKQGHLQAQSYLSQSGAEVLIWGTVLSSGSQVVFKLFWTTNTGEPAKSGRYQPTGNLRLPEGFASDIKSMLSFIVLAQQNEYLRGVYVADQLSSQVEKIKALYEQQGQIWDPQFRVSLRILLAASYGMIGEQANNVKSYKQSLEICRDLMRSVTREQNAPRWAWLKNTEGLSLLNLGDREQTTEKYYEAYASFAESLKFRTREKFPLDWARTQSNLGTAHARIGHRERSAKTLNEAVKLLEEALKEQDPKRAPWERAVTHNRLAGALWVLGTMQSDIASLKRGDTAVRSALAQWTPTRSPLFWGGAQFLLGNILYSLAQLGGGTKNVVEAITSFENAHKVYTRSRNPKEWAEIQNNLGNAFRLGGERDSSSTGHQSLREAVKRLYEVLEIRTQTADPVSWAFTQADLAQALTSLGVRDGDVKKLETADQAYNGAFQVITRKEFPFDWARMKFLRSGTLLAITEKKADLELTCQALQHSREAWLQFSELDLTSQQTSLARERLAVSMQVLEKKFSKRAVGICLDRKP
jgi:tetratricopeptide (TPR) repeat protein